MRQNAQLYRLSGLSSISLSVYRLSRLSLYHYAERPTLPTQCVLQEIDKIGDKRE